MFRKASRANIAYQGGNFQEVVKHPFWLVWSIVINNLRDDRLKAK
jgi:hypothetical protein